MTGSIRLCRLDEIGDGGALEARLESAWMATTRTRPDDQGARSLVLIRRGGTVHAYENVCPHAGRPLNWAPDRFLFTPEGRIVCTVHGATFEVDSGECVLGPCLGARLRAVPVEVVDGVVQLIGQ